MRMSANDIKQGNVLEHDGQLWVVIKKPEHTKPGKGGAFVQVEMKNLRTGSKLNHRFRSTDNVQKAFLEQKPMQYLYLDGENLVVMDPESFEQIMIAKDVIGEKFPLLTDGMEITVEFYQEQVLNIKLPANVIVEIAETDPVIKGSTVTSSYKPAILVNGLKVMVPPYLVTGEKIVIKTEDLTFVERAKK
ncbi:MAG: elongation factor P [Rickettsiaceae bacterium]|nr:elongation factor P [Rickettsiaceae bacterium]